MSLPTETRPLSFVELPPAEQERLRRAAIERAHELRSESIAEFWRSAEARMADAVNHARRAAERLAARLRQHARQRRRA